MKVLSLSEIKQRIDIKQIISMQEKGFMAYSQGKVNVPPVGYLKIKETALAYHIKYGAIDGDDIFVVKLAGKEETSSKGSKIEGLYLIFSSKNGKPLLFI